MIDIVGQIYIMVQGESPLRPHICSVGYASKTLRPYMKNYYRTHAVVHFILEGEGFYSGYRLKKGQGFLVPSATYDTHIAAPENPWSYLWFEIDGVSAESFEQFLSVNEQGIFDFCYDKKCEKFINDFFRQGRVMLSALEAQALLSGFLNCAVPTSIRIEEGMASLHYRNACRYLVKHMAEPIRMTDVAGAEHIDAQYMYNLFMRFAKMSPKKYLSALRLDRACRLLRESSDTVAEIGAVCGYPDGMQFTKFFTRYAKMSPREYRKFCEQNRSLVPKSVLSVELRLPFIGEI